MVFKKPYGFLIKHFKSIHLILTIIYVYLAFKVSGILYYYNNFIAGTVSKLEANSYINYYYIIAILLSIIICLIVYALMRYKKKPRILYLVLIGFTILIAWMISYSYQGLYTIYISVLDTKTMLLYRDLLRIFVLFQYGVVAVVLVRALGFDIKKFNFVQDLQELDIDVADEEEVELTLEGTERIGRKLHRQFRELKYYYLENKLFILIIVGIVMVITGVGIITNVEFINKEYNQNEAFSSEEFRFRVLASYVTNKNFDNQELMDDGTSFVVVRMIVGSIHESRELNTSNLILKINQHSYTSSKKYVNQFIDLGYGYKNQKIEGDTTYLFIYNIRDEDSHSKMKLVYAEDKTVHLKPILLDSNPKMGMLKVGDTLDLSKSSFGRGSFKISSFEVKEQFSYPYQYEVNGMVYTNQFTISSAQNAILHLVIEGNYPYDFNHYTFIDQYGTLKYKIGTQEFSSLLLENKTPGTYKEGLYLMVDKGVLDADSVWLELQIRNQLYLYTLK